MYKTIIKPKNDSSLIDELQDWMWPASDDGGTWGDDTTGPRGDWLMEHQHKWFSHVKNFRNAIQAGGACGMYPRLLSEKFETVYTFEPSPVSFHCLVNNNQETNVIKFQAALGKRVGAVQLSFVPSNVGLTRVTEWDDEHARFPMVTIDMFNFNHVDFIALDLEGFEANALLGAVETINRCKPVIVGEAVEQDATKMKVIDDLGYVMVERSAMDQIFVPK